MPVEQAYDRVPAERAPVRKIDDSSSVAGVIGVILDKGIVIDAWASVSVLGLELLTIQARVVVASVETYLRYAEAIGLTATAARPPWQQLVPGRGKEQEAGGPSEDEVLRNLSEHPEGLQLEAMRARLDVPLERLDEILSHLVEARKVHRDTEHNLYLPEGQ
jgi:gas vesicle structural protein